MEFIKTGYKSHKIIRLYAKFGIMGNYGVNIRELEDQSAIKGKLYQIRPIRVSHLAFWRAKREERKEKRKRRGKVWKL